MIFHKFFCLSDNYLREVINQGTAIIRGIMVAATQQDHSFLGIFCERSLALTSGNYKPL